MIRIILAAVIMVAMLVRLAPASAITICPLEEAMKRLEAYNRTPNGEVAQKQMPILTELQALTSKAKNPGLPTGAQLTKADQDRFQQLREQMLSLQTKVIVNSGYLRDSALLRMPRRSLTI